MPFVEMQKLLLDEGDNRTWIHAIRPGKYKHPQHDTLDFSPDKLRQLADSVNNRAKGIDVAIDYAHNNMGEAAGWVKEAVVDEHGLWLHAEFTDEAADAIRKGKWKYFSPEIDPIWEGPDGSKRKNVLSGGGLTNRPFLKNTEPLRFSEPTTEEGTMEELLEALRQHYELSEKATEEEVLKAFNDSINKEPQSLDESATVTHRDDGTIQVQVSGFDGELVVTPQADESAEDGELAQLAESNPAIKQILDERKRDRERLARLEMTQTLAETNDRLDQVLSEANVTLGPAQKSELTSTLVKLDESTRESVINVVGDVIKNGTVDLSERHGGQGKPSSDNSDPSTDIDKKARQLMSEKDGLTYRQAVSMVLSEDQSLYSAHRQQVEGR